MWWSRALLVAALLALGPAGCGFQPLYGRSPDRKGIGDELASVRVLNIEDRLGQQLRNALVERVSPRGEPPDPRYLLAVKLSQATSGLGVQRDATASLARMDVSATFTLSDGERAIFSGTATSVVSFNLLGPRYGSVAVERDAEARAVNDLAEEIRNQVAVFLTNPAGMPRRPVTTP